MGGVRRWKAHFTANITLEFGGVLAEVVEEARSSGCEVEIGIPRLRFFSKAFRKRPGLTQGLVEGLPVSVRVGVRKIRGGGVPQYFMVA